MSCKSYPNGLYILVYGKNKTVHDVDSAWLYRIILWACVSICFVVSVHVWTCSLNQCMFVCVHMQMFPRVQHCTMCVG